MLRIEHTTIFHKTQNWLKYDTTLKYYIQIYTNYTDFSTTCFNCSMIIQAVMIFYQNVLFKILYAAIIDVCIYV